MLDQIKEKLKSIQKQKDDLVTQLRNDFAPMLSPLLQKSEKIESIGWTQYTPYFNDGDECVFGVNNDDILINDKYDYDFDQDENFFDQTLGWGVNERQNPNYKPYEGNILSQIKEILYEIPDSFYKDLFGDHVKVTIKHDGTVETEEYEHD